MTSGLMDETAPVISLSNKTNAMQQRMCYQAAFLYSIPKIAAMTPNTPVTDAD